MTPAKNIISALAGIMIFFIFGTCAAQVDFKISSVIPVARGTVNVKKDKYNNYVIKLDLMNLAEAGRLTPPKNTYFVWMVTEDNMIKNIGQVRTTTGVLSKKLKASFETKSSFKPVKIFITAEYDPNIQSTTQLLC